jgi:hypothetical protein
VPLKVSVIEPEGEIINVAAKVLLAGVMINADEAVLNDSENALNAVRRHVTADKFAFIVVDGILAEEHTADASVSCDLDKAPRRWRAPSPVRWGLRRSICLGRMGQDFGARKISKRICLCSRTLRRRDCSPRRC